jgi:hypothetical protein
MPYLVSRLDVFKLNRAIFASGQRPPQPVPGSCFHELAMYNGTVGNFIADTVKRTKASELIPGPSLDQTNSWELLQSILYL